jgi:hypothetical protein
MTPPVGRIQEAFPACLRDSTRAGDRIACSLRRSSVVGSLENPRWSHLDGPDSLSQDSSIARLLPD